VLFAAGASLFLVDAAATSAGAAPHSSNIIVTYAGNGRPGDSGDGHQATTAQLDVPSGVVLDNAANVFIADTANHRVRKVTANGVITTVAGTGSRGLSGDGGPATAARLDCPTGLAADGAGDLFIADTGNNRVREVDRHGVIHTVAGKGDSDDSADREDDPCGKDLRHPDADIDQASSAYIGAERIDDNGKPARSATLRRPTGLALDGVGDLFIADTGNNLVREVTSDGHISILAGNGRRGDSGNTGPATSAKLDTPTGVAVSGSKVLIADAGNHEVREVYGGTITRFAGTGRPGDRGDGHQAAAAELRWPISVAFDPLGDVYIVDSVNNRIRQVDGSGVISTFAGTGEPGYSGDGGPAELARIRPAGGVTTDANNVFFSDTFNNRVRRIHKGGPPPALPESRTLLLFASALAVLAGGVLLARRGARKRTHPARG
jgi:hypothetical protein